MSSRTRGKSRSESPPTEEKKGSKRRKKSFCVIGECKGEWINVETIMKDNNVSQEWEWLNIVYDSPDWLSNIRLRECGAKGSCGFFVFANWLELNFDMDVEQDEVRDWFAEQLHFRKDPGRTLAESVNIQQIRDTYFPTFNLSPYIEDPKKKLRVSKEEKEEAVPDRSILAAYIDDIVRAQDVKKFESDLKAHALKHSWQMDDYVLSKLADYEFFVENRIGFITMKLLPDQNSDNTVFCQVYPRGGRNRDRFIVLYNFGGYHWMLFGTQDGKSKTVVSDFTRSNLHPLLLQSRVVQNLLAGHEDKKESKRTEPKKEENKEAKGSLGDYTDVIESLDDVTVESDEINHCLKDVESKRCQYILTWMLNPPCVHDVLSGDRIGSPVEEIIFHVKTDTHKLYRLCMDGRKLKRWVAVMRANQSVQHQEDLPYKEMTVPTKPPNPPLLLNEARLKRVDQLMVTKHSFEQDIKELAEKAENALLHGDVLQEQVALAAMHFYMFGVRQKFNSVPDVIVRQFARFGYEKDLLRLQSVKVDPQVKWIEYAFHSDMSFPYVVWKQ